MLPKVLVNMPSCDYVSLYGAQILKIFMFSESVHLAFLLTFKSLTKAFQWKQTLLASCFLSSRLVVSIFLFTRVENRLYGASLYPTDLKFIRVIPFTKNLPYALFLRIHLFKLPSHSVGIIFLPF